MKYLINGLIIAAISICVVGCGKKGELLPPPGYEAPAENSGS